MKKDYLVLLALWLLATLLNLNKAFHIDDAFHLEAAQWIAQHPLRPMSGFICWYEVSEPIYTFNQPPLFFYLIALTGTLFGFSELPLHLMQAVFTGLAIVCFYKLCQLVRPRVALAATALLALNPAFLVNQNLMVDIPILSLSLLFMYLLLSPTLQQDQKRYVLAALVLSAGLLIKYTLLPLYLLLWLSMLLRRKYKLLPVALLPLAVLGLWSWFNLVEFNGIHIMGRSVKGMQHEVVAGKFISFFITLGAIAPFSIVFFRFRFKNAGKTFWWFVAAAAALYLLLLLYALAKGLNYRTPSFLLWLLFLGNGLAVVSAILYCHRHLCELNANKLLFLLWAVLLSAFTVAFAPFMATRHVLLMLPPLLLLALPYLEQVAKWQKQVAVVLTAFLGLSLGISDWLYAGFYRTAATEAMQQLPEQATVWTAGHWGWQWYSRQAGMQPYELNYAEVKAGDYFVLPAEAPKQQLNPEMKLTETGTIEAKSSFATFFSTAKFASFYNTDHTRVPWSFSTKPADKIIIYRVAAAQ